MGGGKPSCISQGSETPVKKNSEEENKKPIKIKISLFFDGTLNNKTNTESRLYSNKYFKKNAKQGSYNNAKSNIAHLNEYLLFDKNSSPNFDNHFNLYIEGIGTTDNEGDSILKGAAFGMGDTGIPAKVEKAINQVISFIKSVKNNDKIISLLEIDAFGFSRGAAAARNFIHESKIGKKNIKNQLLQFTEVEELKYNFIGLLDTVSHYGFNMDDDVAELKLDAISHAQTVVQLSGGDEYRHNFPLINVKSNGTQIELPGVHSDIGGGYLDSVDELKIEILRVDESDFKKIRIRFEREIKWIKNEGWFRDDEITDNGSYVELNRKGIKNTYTIIPRLIMANHSIITGLKYSSALIASDTLTINNNTNLKKLYEILTPLGNENWKKELELMKSIRHDFFHFSSYYDGIFINANEPEWTGGNAMTGIRKRITYDG